MDNIKSTGRLRYVEPTNLNIDSEYSEKINFPYEDYSMAIDLTIKMGDRKSGGWSTENELTEYKFSSTNGSLSFLGGTIVGEDNVLTTNYTDISMTSPGKNTSECLGVESISITYNSWLYPQVVIKFVDVRGATVMMPSEYEYYNGKENPISTKLYKALFTFPYPMFILKVKGFYGKGTTYKLALEKTDMEFNSSTGNFNITATFIGYMYGIYADFPMTYLAAAPFMEGGREYWENKVNDKVFCFRDSSGNVSAPMCDFPTLKSTISSVAGNQNIINKSKKGEERVASFDSEVESLDTLRDLYPYGSYNLIKYEKEYYYVKCVESKDIDVNEECNKIGTYFARLKNSNVGKNYIEKLFENCTVADEFALKVKHNETLLVNVKDGKIIDTYHYNINKKNYEKWYNERSNMFANVSFKEGARKALDAYNKDNRLLYNGEYYVFLAPLSRRNVMKYINDRFTNIDKEREEVKKEYLDEVEKEVEKALGFKPSIRNIYELIFAHMETFMYCFFTQTKKINEALKSKDATRSKKTFGLEGNVTDTDEKDTLLPPYFAAYEERSVGNSSKRIVNKWPGSFPNGMRYLEEVKFVTNLLNSCELYYKTNEALNSDGADEEEVEGEDGEKTVEVKTGGVNKSLKVNNLIPITNYDFIFSQNGNPYSCIKELIDKGDFSGAYLNILRIFITRMFYAMSEPSVYLSDEKSQSYGRKHEMDYQEMLGNIEAINFFKAIGIPSDRLFKKLIEKLEDNVDIKEICSELKYGANVPNITSDVIFSVVGNSLNYNNGFFPIGEYKLNDIKKDFVEGIETEKFINLDKSLERTDFLDSFHLIEGDYFFKDLTDALSHEFSNVKVSSSSKNVLKNEYGKLFLNNDDLKENLITDYKRRIGTDYYLNNYYDSNSFYIVSNSIESTATDEDLNKVLAGDVVESKIYIKHPAKKRILGKEMSLFSQMYNVGSLEHTLLGRQSENVNIYGLNNDSILSKAYLFLSSMIVEDAYEFNGVQRASKSESTLKSVLLREGAFYWREDLEDGVDIIVPNGYISPLKTQTFYNDGGVMRSESDVLFLTKDSDHTYKTWASPVFSSASRRTKLKEYFIKWAETEYAKYEPYLLNLQLYEGEDYDKGLNLTLLSTEGSKLNRLANNLQEFLKDIYFSRCTTIDLYDGFTSIAGGKVAPISGRLLDIERTLKYFTKALYKIYCEDISIDEDTVVTFSGQDLFKNTDLKLSTYLTLKSLYDKWLASSIDGGREWKLNRKEGDNTKSDFDNFVYVDTFYNDIGYHLNVNIDKIASLINTCIPSSNPNGGETSTISTSTTVYNFLATVAQDCGGMLMALPTKFGLRSGDNIAEMFKPMPIYSDWEEDSSTFLFMYTYKPSEHLGDNSNRDMNGWSPKGDGLDLTDEELTGKLFSTGDGYVIPAFGVTYGKQNQSIFKNIRLSSESTGVTEAALAATVNIASKGAENPRESTLYGQDLYKVYSSYSYKCSVSSMGNMQIMPMMYFQLNNIPLWKGAYQIVKVNHEISAGAVDTTFEGLRINRYAIPLVNGDIITVKNKDGFNDAESSESRQLTKSQNGDSTNSTTGNSEGSLENKNKENAISSISKEDIKPNSKIKLNIGEKLDNANISETSPIIALSAAHSKKRKRVEHEWSKKIVNKILNILKTEKEDYKFINGGYFIDNVYISNEAGDKYSGAEVDKLIQRYGSKQVVSVVPHWNGGNGNYYLLIVDEPDALRSDSLKLANAMREVVKEVIVNNDKYFTEEYVPMINGGIKQWSINEIRGKEWNNNTRKTSDWAPRKKCASILTENWFADWNNYKGKEWLDAHIEDVARMHCDALKRYMDQLV